MRDTRFSPPPGRAAFKAAQAALIALAGVLAAAVALSSGCGGSKSDQSSSTTPASSPAPTTAPGSTVTPIDTASGTSATPADLGAQVFAKRCALCHGADGHGDGVGSKGLKPQPRNFHDRAYMSTRPDTSLLRVIHQGKGPMPRWGGVLSEAEIDAVLKHVRALGEKP